MYKIFFTITTFGLYFSCLRDIPKMDRKLAKDMFTFSHHLLSEERDRALIFEIQRQGRTSMNSLPKSREDSRS